MCVFQPWAHNYAQTVVLDEFKHLRHRPKVADGLAPASVRQHHAILHKALKQAQRWHLVSENAANAIDAVLT